MKIGEKDFKGYCGSAEVDKIYLGTALVFENTTHPDDEMWYTSTDGNIVTPYADPFNVGILSNTYVNGKGIIKCSGSINTINSNAFKNCNTLETVELPNTVTLINSGAFYSCTSLISIGDLSSVTKITSQVFQNCSSLTSIGVLVKCNTINGNVFNGCTSLTSITINKTTPPTLGGNSLTGNHFSAIYVPASAVETYKGANYWKNYSSIIQAMP